MQVVKLEARRLVGKAIPGAWARAGALWRAVGDNPVLTLSLRRGMRRGSTFALQFAYVLVLMALTAIIYLYVLAGPAAPGGAGQRMGRLLFLWIALGQTLFLSSTASVLGGATIALEREHHTFEALQLSSLSSVEILCGKYFSLLLLHALLIATSIPIACLGFLFGGVSPAEVGTAALLTFLSTAAALAVGLACSADCLRSAPAVSAATALTIGGLIGIPALGMSYASHAALAGTQYTSWLLALIALNPLFAETHLFLRAPGIPPEAVYLNAFMLAAVGLTAWLTALARLQSESVLSSER